jgi:hypothetical protein
VNSIEDLLRAAYHHAADAVAAEGLRPPPRASGSPAGSRLRRQVRRQERRRAHRLSHAALAATAVLVVASSAALIPHFLSEHGRSTRGDGQARLLWHGAPPGPPPKFFAVLTGSGKSIQFLSATSGGVIGHVLPPSAKDYFSGVAAEPGDRTFVAAVERASGGGCMAHLFQVRLDEAGEPGRLRPMAEAPLQGILPQRTMALSPGGSKLAYFAYNCAGSGQLVVTDLRTSSSTTWTGQPGEDPLSVSLSADGAIVSVSGFEFRGYTQGAKPGTSAVRLRLATEILHAPGRYASLDSGAIVLNEATETALSPAGTILYACGTQGGNEVLSAYAVASRKRLAVLALWPRATGSCSMAMAPSGGYLLLGDVAGHLAIFDNATGRLSASSATGVGASDRIVW